LTPGAASGRLTTFSGMGPTKTRRWECPLSDATLDLLLLAPLVDLTRGGGTGAGSMMVGIGCEGMNSLGGELGSVR
jgi:hypothetical protein